MAFLGTGAQSNHSQHSQRPPLETTLNGDTHNLTKDRTHEEQTAEGGVIVEDS